MKIRCGFVAILGLPNAGKSSLINSIVGEKVSIVSPKPQTTRNNILGIYNDDSCQVIFIDTPGINSASSGLDKFMQKSIKGATTDVNAVIVAVDITKGVSKKEKEILFSCKKDNIPAIIVLTKCDLKSTQFIAENIMSLSKDYDVEIIPTSSLKHKNLQSIIDVVKKYLPEIDETSRYYEIDEYTDKPLNFLVAEIVREKALFLLDKEIPHGIAVVTQNYEDQGDLVNIDVDIVCEKQTHKAIILGSQGSMLKKIGHNARVTIQKILQKKVVLNLFIKVKPNWKNNPEYLNLFGYDINQL